ncbi:hypothetical protein C2I18_25485 [Paenibacillus sp. PK3_47]|nr:hypothetical protein C2I18_25485 [Paenibacillus sp. PK3_47]
MLAFDVCIGKINYSHKCNNKGKKMLYIFDEMLIVEIRLTAAKELNYGYSAVMIFSQGRGCRVWPAHYCIRRQGQSMI